MVGIDSEAGPTEIAILADDTAEPAYVAADLISQAEHDPMAAAVLVTPSSALVGAVEAELERQVAQTKHTERVGQALSGRQSAIIVVDDLDQGEEVVNAYAAEHLEIITTDASTRAARIRNAGAVFVGAFAPVSLGDYAAGSNHVLPTAGCACHSSGLSVRSFLKTVQVIDYDRDALAEAAPRVITLADAEDLPGARRRRADPARTMTAPDGPGLPVRPELVGIEPYGAPQLDVPRAPQRQREPVPSLARGRRRDVGRRRRGRDVAQPLSRSRGHPAP